MKRSMYTTVVAVAACSVSAAAFAHSVSGSRLILDPADRENGLEIIVSLEDLAQVIELDADRDGRIFSNEITAASEPAARYIGSRVLIADADGQACALIPPTDASATLQNAGGGYVAQRFGVDCAEEGGTLHIRSRLFADIDPEHHLSVSTRSEGLDRHVSMLTPADEGVAIDLR